jgi:hypothetical protein
MSDSMLLFRRFTRGKSIFMSYSKVALMKEVFSRDRHVVDAIQLTKNSFSLKKPPCVLFRKTGIKDPLRCFLDVVAHSAKREAVALAVVDAVG